jgi:antitoxin component YwqK of YwqJK toxin-antitoxin module
VRYFAVIIFLFAGVIVSLAQKYSDQVQQVKKYTEKEAVDPDFGIILYNKMISALGGDSIRYNKGGYNLQGWQEDYYASGKVMHKGFYVDGLIKVFKNFYENGQVERNFVVSDPKRCSLETYYPDGKVRSQVYYYDGNPQKEYDFFPNGNPEYVEENDKDLTVLYKRNSYFENGQPSSLFELIEKKARKYLKKDFFENGKLKEEGFMLFRKDLGDYAKEGEWSTYNDKGDLVKKEKYLNGQLE